MSQFTIRTVLSAFLMTCALSTGGAATTVILQPSGGLNDGSDGASQTAGKDTGYANGPSGADGAIHWISNPTWAGPGRAYFQFDPMSVVSPGTVATSATLTLSNLFRTSIGWPRAETLILDTVNAAWDETTVTSVLPTTAFASATVNPNSEWTVIPDPFAPSLTAIFGQTTFDVTTLVQSWIDSPASNFGVAYGIGGSAYPYNTIDPYVFTSDAAGISEAFRPLLTIEFDAGESIIPEPAPLAVFGLGLVGIILYRGKNRA